MNRITTFGLLTEVASAFLNALQDLVLGLTDADTGGGYTNEWTQTGGHGVHFQSAVALPAGEPVVLDVSRNWLQNVVTGWCRTTATATHRIDGGADYILNDLTAGPTNTAVWLFTGTGAYNDISVGSGGDVGVGAPPVNGTNVRTSYAGVIYDGGSGAVVWLYVDPGTGKLYAYNDTGGALYLILGVTGCRAIA